LIWQLYDVEDFTASSSETGLKERVSSITQYRQRATDEAFGLKGKCIINGWSDYRGHAWPGKTRFNCNCIISGYVALPIWLVGGSLRHGGRYRRHENDGLVVISWALKLEKCNDSDKLAVAARVPSEGLFILMVSNGKAREYYWQIVHL
jgi:hypothetical protein